MSSVFLSDVDDFLMPSQACVNPLFADSINNGNNPSSDRNEKKSDKDKSSASDAPNSTTNNEGAVVIPKRRVRRKKRQPQVTMMRDEKEQELLYSPPSLVSDNGTAMDTKILTSTKNDSLVTASMADCLACSGCVTTAETMLVEQHSLDKLEEQVLIRDDGTKRTVVMTMSPASLADLKRHVLRRNDSPMNHGAAHDSSKEESFASLEASFEERIVTLLHEGRLGVARVLDGNVALLWSLRGTAEQFVEAYRKKQGENPPPVEFEANPPRPSIAVSAMEYQVVGEPTSVKVSKDEAAGKPSLPLLTSSCPALVCLTEKTFDRAVPLLSSVKSPMALAGSYWKHQYHQKEEPLIQSKKVEWQLFHVAIMPCHDKKLEASRKDLAWPSRKMADGTLDPDVDLVLTTQELLDLLEKDAVEAGFKSLLEQLHSMTPKVLKYNGMTDPSKETDRAVWISLDGNEQGVKSMSSDSFFSLGSGGYADYCFRFACKELFDFDITSDDPLPWTAAPLHLSSTNTTSLIAGEKRMVSARIAARRRRNKASSDYHQIVLYRKRSAGKYTLDHGDDDDYEAVLRFATAYGLQTLQRALHPFKKEASSQGTTTQEQQGASHQPFPFDFVEAMACPSGCLNGGGQIRSMAKAVSTEQNDEVLSRRETPTETRERVEATKSYFTSVNAARYLLGKEGHLFYPKVVMAAHHVHTRFHVVPELQHTMGAAAGVKIQDTQW